jgi:hypothetical protein
MTGNWKTLSSPLATAVKSIADQLCHALRAGFSIEEIFNLTKIDRWFLLQIKEIVDFEEAGWGDQLKGKLLWKKYLNSCHRLR